MLTFFLFHSLIAVVRQLVDWCICFCFLVCFLLPSWLMHLLLGWAWSLVVHLLHVICALSLHLWNINLTHVRHALVLVKNQGYTCIVSYTFLFSKEILLKWHCLLIYGWWTSQYNNRYFYCHRLPSLPRKDSKSVFFLRKNIWPLCYPGRFDMPIKIEISKFYGHLDYCPSFKLKIF